VSFEHYSLGQPRYGTLASNFLHGFGEVLGGDAQLVGVKSEAPLGGVVRVD
jgi:hypothetical protein